MRERRVFWVEKEAVGIRVIACRLSGSSEGETVENRSHRQKTVHCSANTDPRRVGRFKASDVIVSSIKHVIAPRLEVDRLLLCVQTVHLLALAPLPRREMQR